MIKSVRSRTNEEGGKKKEVRTVALQGKE